MCKRNFDSIVTQDGARAKIYDVPHKDRPPPEEEEFPHHLVDPLERMLQELRDMGATGGEELGFMISSNSVGNGTQRTIVIRYN